MRARVGIGLFIILVNHFAWADSRFLSESFAKKTLSTSQTRLKDPFFKNHTLVFFFSSQCGYCQQFAPLVKQWATVQEAPVLALSFDNQPLASFPDARPVTKEWSHAAYAGKPITYPALFIANRQNHLLYPVVFGAMGSADLDQRLKHIQSKIEAYEAARAMS